MHCIVNMQIGILGCSCDFGRTASRGESEETKRRRRDTLDPRTPVHIHGEDEGRRKKDAVAEVVRLLIPGMRRPQHRTSQPRGQGAHPRAGPIEKPAVSAHSTIQTTSADNSPPSSVHASRHRCSHCHWRPRAPRSRLATGGSARGPSSTHYRCWCSPGYPGSMTPRRSTRSRRRRTTPSHPCSARSATSPPQRRDS